MVLPLPKRKNRNPTLISVDGFDQEIYEKIVTLCGKYPDIKPTSATNLNFNDPIVAKAAQKWLLDNGMYQFPTIELTQWLKNRINNRAALEICAGHGWLGENLEVRSTDGWVFNHPALKSRSELFGTQNCNPLDRVERLKADVAVFKYKPQVVFGCYVTHTWDYASKSGSALGVDDEDIFGRNHVKEYIVIGCLSVHALRPFLKKKHETFQFPWLFGRGKDARIWSWKK